MAIATQPSSAAPASLFGMPGVTRRLENKENNDGVTQALNQSSQIQQAGLQSFKQTDVIYGWQVELTHALTLTPGTGAITVSPYFPYNFLGNVQLNMQNQYSTINVESGVDLALFQTIRPMRKGDRRNALYTTTSSLYNAATNQVALSTYNNASTSVLTRFEMPAGLWFDQYFELAADGTPLNSAPLKVFVSPQYMAGTARIVTPQLTWNPLAATVSDGGPYTVTGNATIADTVTENFRRIGIYQPQGQADSPPVFNWQLVRQTKRFSLSGVSAVSLPMPLNGQVLAVYVRMFDPAASSNLGAPIAISSVSECDLVYGSGLFAFQDTPTDTQARYIAQHGTLLPKGVLAWDMATDDQDNITNRYALNTMNTSGIQVNLTFTGTQSSSAYAVVGVETLQFVTL